MRITDSDRDLWEGAFSEEAFTFNSMEPMDFEFLDHDEALNVFRSPRPSNTLDELEKLAIRERLMRETGDYPPGFPFRFETHNTSPLEDFRSQPVIGIPQEEGNGFSDTADLGEDLGGPRPVFAVPVEDNPWMSEVTGFFNEADDLEGMEIVSR